jgi:hypothetical protein
MTPGDGRLGMGTAHRLQAGRGGSPSTGGLTHCRQGWRQKRLPSRDRASAQPQHTEEGNAGTMSKPGSGGDFLG